MKQKSKNIVHQDLLGKADIYTAGLDNAEQQGDFSPVKRVFEQSNAFDFTSGVNKIETPSDVAYIFKKLEDKAIENSFAVLVKNGDPTVLHLGMGTARTTPVDTVSLISAAERLKPDRIYFVHNHPSGNLTASSGDMQVYAGIKAVLGEKLMPGIIINLRSGKFGTFDDNGNLDRFEHKIHAQKEIPLKLYSFSKQVFDRDYNPEKNFKIKNSSDVAQFICSHRLGERRKMSFLVLQSGHHAIGNILTPYTEITRSNMEKITKDMVLKAGMLGGTSVIAYGTFSGVDLCGNLMQSIKEKSLGNIEMLDAVYIDRKIGMYTSWGDNGGFYSKLPADGFEPLPQAAEADMTCKHNKRQAFVTNEDMRKYPLSNFKNERIMPHEPTVEYTHNTSKNLNDKEQKVLFACMEGRCEFDGKYFQSEDVWIEGMTKNEMNGYLSQLKQKGYMNTQEDAYYSAFFTRKGLEYVNQNRPQDIEDTWQWNNLTITQNDPSIQEKYVELQASEPDIACENPKTPPKNGLIILTRQHQLDLKNGKDVEIKQIIGKNGERKDIIVRKTENGLKVIEKKPLKSNLQYLQIPAIRQAKRKL